MRSAPLEYPSETTAFRGVHFFHPYCYSPGDVTPLVGLTHGLYLVKTGFPRFCCRGDLPILAVYLWHLCHSPWTR